MRLLVSLFCIGALSVTIVAKADVVNSDSVSGERTIRAGMTVASADNSSAARGDDSSAAHADDSSALSHGELNRFNGADDFEFRGRGDWHHEHGPNRGIPVPIPFPVPAPYPRPYPPPGPRFYQCFAQDAYGRQFRASGYDTFGTQQMALNECFRVSNYGCVTTGCLAR